MRTIRRLYHGFTIVELLVVIVVIGILAAVTVISYVGVQQKAVVASLQSDLSNSAIQLKLFLANHSNYPATIDCGQADSTTNKCLKASPGNTYDASAYAASVNNSSNPQTFTLTSTSANGICYQITNNSKPVDCVPVVTAPNITYVGIGTFGDVYNASSATPSYPAGWQPGDLLIFFTRWNCTWSNWLTVAPAGWTSLFSTSLTTGQNFAGASYRIAAEGDDTTPTFTGGPNLFGTTFIVAYRGVSPTNYIADTAVTKYVTSDNILRATNVTTAAPSVLIFIGAFDNSATLSSLPTNPGTFTQRATSAMNYTSSNVVVADYAWSSSGNAGNIDATLSTAVAVKSAIVVAVK